LFNKKSSNKTNLTVKLKISNSNGQNINIIKPSFEVNIQNHNHNVNNNNNCININNPIFNNIQCKHSRNVDNIFNNPTEIINKMNLLKHSTDKHEMELKHKKVDGKLKSSSSNQKNVKTNTVDEGNSHHCEHSYSGSGGVGGSGSGGVNSNTKLKKNNIGHIDIK